MFCNQICTTSCILTYLNSDATLILRTFYIMNAHLFCQCHLSSSSPARNRPLKHLLVLPLKNSLLISSGWYHTDLIKLDWLVVVAAERCSVMEHCKRSPWRPQAPFFFPDYEKAPMTSCHIQDSELSVLTVGMTIGTWHTLGVDVWVMRES